MTLWTNKQTEETLRTVFELDIPNGNGNIYHNGIQVGYADGFSGIRLSKKMIEPEALNDMCVWNPYETTNFEIDKVVIRTPDDRITTTDGEYCGKCRKYHTGGTDENCIENAASSYRVL